MTLSFLNGMFQLFHLIREVRNSLVIASECPLNSSFLLNRSSKSDLQLCDMTFSGLEDRRVVHQLLVSRISWQPEVLMQNADAKFEFILKAEARRI
ncbi:hypothetical protein L596_000435 [Steinernema carpocapsae]|uniref:Uncharacterized protein n=1 Tax=Steinernema carpocapsae TaxID=34508 RepID=A0A4U8UIU2_STECR|nr:hypothetical protein L596_000435 [Steinernema carpocapsae]